MNQKEQDNKLKKTINKIIENYIIHAIFVIMILGIVLINKGKFNQLIYGIIYKVLSENELLRNISLGICGFSITVISLFGVGISNSILLLNEKSLIDKFIRLIKTSVTISGIVFTITVLLNAEDMIKCGYSDITRYFLWIYFCVVLYSLLAFIRVVVIVFAMFTHNLDSINKQNDAKEIEEINRKLEEIIQILKRKEEIEEINKIEELINEDEFLRFKKDAEENSKKYNKE